MPDRGPTARCTRLTRAERSRASPSIRSSSAWQIASSCMGFARLGGEHLVVDFPRRARLLRGHLLDGVPDVDHHELADRRGLVLEQEQADVPLYSFGAAARDVAVDRDHFHRNAQAHGSTPDTGATGERAGQSDSNRLSVPLGQGQRYWTLVQSIALCHRQYELFIQI